MPDWLDITIPLKNGLPPWPGDMPFRREIVAEIGGGSLYNLSTLAMSAHTGTHLDAPKHFVAGGAGIDGVSPGLLIGPAYVLDLSQRAAAGHIAAEELEGRVPEGATRVLVKTRNSALLGDGVFHEDFTALTTEAVEYLVKRGVRLLGFDYYSFAPYEAPAQAHRALLRAPGAAALECADLTQAEEGWYDLVCLPLRVEGGDGAPARALIRKREGRP